MAHCIKHKLTFECLESTAKLMNSMPGATVELPTTKYKLIKSFKSICSFKEQFHIYCESCKIYSECIAAKEETWICAKCIKKLKVRETNHFVYIKLEEQLIQILNKHWDKIIGYNSAIISDNYQNIKDTYSGTFIQASLEKNLNILSLMINTDGVSLKKASVNSAWPLTCSAIFYLREYVI